MLLACIALEGWIYLNRNQMKLMHELNLVMTHEWEVRMHDYLPKNVGFEKKCSKNHERKVIELAKNIE